MFIFFISTALANPNPRELTHTLQSWAARLGGTVVVGTAGPDAYKLAQRAHAIDGTLNMAIQPMPVGGNVERNLRKALRAHQTRCGLHLQIEKNDWSLMPVGECKDNVRSLQVDPEAVEWQVKDNRGQSVNAMDYALLMGDTDLIDVLRSEQANAHQVSRALLWGGGTLAGVSLLPLSGMEPGMPPAAVDRLWTTVYLLSTASMLLVARHIPAQNLTDQHENVAAYLNTDEAQARILQRWPLELPEDEEQENEPAQDVFPLLEELPPADETPAEEQAPTENTPTTEDFPTQNKHPSTGEQYNTGNVP